MFIKAQSDKKKAVALGFFDGVHIGHRTIINKILLEKNLTPTIFTFLSDENIPKFQNNSRNLIFSDEKKIQTLYKLGAEIIFAPKFSDISGLYPKEFVRDILVNTLNAKVVVCGEDFCFGKGKDKKPGASSSDLFTICKEYNIKTEIIPTVKYDGKTVSSSLIRTLLKEGKVDSINALGTSIEYELPIIKGKQLGNLIGFPTINQKFPSNLILPRFGVYCSEIEIEKENFQGITNIGIKPTVNKDCENILLETFIFDFYKNVYGKTANVKLTSFIREEKKFASISALTKQIKTDILVSRKKK